jgi:hypothetical protein
MRNELPNTNATGVQLQTIVEPHLLSPAETDPALVLADSLLILATDEDLACTDDLCLTAEVRP